MRMRRATSKETRNVPEKLTGIAPTVQSIRQRLGPETLLQRHKLLCCEQALPCAVSVDAKVLGQETSGRRERAGRMVSTPQG